MSTIYFILYYLNVTNFTLPRIFFLLQVMPKLCETLFLTIIVIVYEESRDLW